MKNCLQCNAEFEPKNSKGVFCSTKCRVAYGRSGRLREIHPSIKTAAEFFLDTAKEDKPDAEPASDDLKRLQEFCKLYKTTPDDLFSWLMDNFKPKSGDKKKPDKKTSATEGDSAGNVAGNQSSAISGRYDRRKTKLGW